MRIPSVLVEKRVMLGNARRLSYNFFNSSCVN